MFKKLAPDFKKLFIYLGAFFIPMAILGIAYVNIGISPTGDNTILICDMSGQYVDFYSTYYEILTKGRSLLFSWQAGLGLNFIGIFAYYLSSPFSLLILLFDQANLSDALWLITLIKVGTCGLSFLIYSRYLFRISPIIQLIFSVSYALMSYSIVYSFNLMWLDGVVFLPLILLGTEKLLREDKPLLFIVSLILMFIANFYISYMVGIFVLLYFLASFFAKHSFSDLKLFFSKLGHFAIGTIWAAGCCAILLIPTFYALKNGQGGPDLSLFNWEINFKLFDLFSKAPLGAYDTLKYEGLPNIYCGLLSLFLLPLYFFNQKISGKEKIIYGVFLGLLLFSFNFSNLDILWHGFDRPNWFPYRYSFVFSFLVIFLALRSFCFLEHISVSRISHVAVIWIIILVLLQKLRFPYLSDKLLMISLFLIVLYAFILTGFNLCHNKRKVLLVFLTAIIILETTLNTAYLVVRMDREFSYATKEYYNNKLLPLKEIIADVKALDDNQGFYRLERIGGRTFNDPMNLNYNGISHFSSMSNYDVIKTLRQLGFLTTASYKSINFAGSTPITESLLGIKYVLSATDKGLGYKEVVSKDDFSAYQNQYALPIGFMADQLALLFDPIKDDNPFRLQNKLVNNLLGNEATTESHDYFRSIPVQRQILKNVIITHENGKEIIKRIDNSLEGSVEYILNNPRDQQVYACFQTIDSTVQIHINDQEIKGYLPLYNKRIIDLGYRSRTDKIRIKLVFENQSLSLAEKYFYGLDKHSLEKAIGSLQAGGLRNVEVTDTSVQGTVMVAAKDLLFTSLLYDPGWRVYIDGEEGSIQKVGQGFIGVTLPEGEHQVVFRFRPKGFLPGLIISVVSLLSLLIAIIYRHYFRASLL